MNRELMLYLRSNLSPLVRPRKKSESARRVSTNVIFTNNLNFLVWQEIKSESELRGFPLEALNID